MEKVYIESGNYEYASLFIGMGYAIVYSHEAADLVVFTGGEDVDPALYGDSKHPHTYSNHTRDLAEQSVYNWCHYKGIPMVGICRGAQFLNVMNDGRMYQHVTNHTRSHFIVDVESGQRIFVTSTHHQMMMPGIQGKVLAVASNVPSSREWYDKDVFCDDEDYAGIEVVSYPASKCLCFQPHPEMGQERGEYADMREYFAKLVEELVK